MKTASITEADEGIRLDRWFKRHHPGLPHAMLEKHLRKGMIRLDGKKAKTSDRLEAGQTLTLPDDLTENLTPLPKKPKHWEPSEHDLTELKRCILYKDANILVLNKPSGLSVQGGSGQGKNLDDMLDGLIEGQGERPRLVHRLDKDTSGVIVLARTAKAAAELGKRFAGKDLEKIYVALVNGLPLPLSGTIKLPLAKLLKGKDSAYEAVGVDEDEGRPAVTDYEVREHLANRLSWVQLKPITGRTHQLRVHMNAIGHPIIGDGKYGGPNAFIHGIDLPRTLHLHAERIIIPRFFGKTIDVRAPLPPHMQQSRALLGMDQ